MSRRHHLPKGTRLARAGGVALLSLLLAGPAIAEPELEPTEKKLLKGEYEEVIKDATEALNGGRREEDWLLLGVRAQLATGKYADALEVINEGLQQFPYSIRMRLLAYHVFRANGDVSRAVAVRDEIDRLGGYREWAYREPADRVALGRAAVILGADPKRVLDLFFDPVKKAAPDYRESYLASGELALEKNDFKLAGRTFAAAARKFPDDPEMHFGLARAYAPSDPETMAEALEKVLELNPRHAGALLLLAENHIDAERYDEARRSIDAVLKVNPHHHEAHAYRAVIAHLKTDDAAEKEAREAALKFWPTNPAVPHLIGRKLSQKYRFAEGAKLQREALEFDPDYVPAKLQLANDLLRLGEEEEGWKLAEEVQKADPYDVVAYNLVTLRDAMAHFRELKTEHFLIRMDPHEAEIYGPRVIELLEKAHGVMTKKYGLALRDRTVVEIFPRQQDFAIRTFGLPGGIGYLGVCFGRVITANSPAANPGTATNWESVLWHEFAHVITLTLTKNRMPRWLSEGISVYEERQARGNWGERMTPRYRRMILGEDLTPVSKLSGAFMAPKTPVHLQFAYYESSLVVEWLIEKFGMEKMRKVLGDLARGVEINAALATHFAPMEQLDKEFADHAKKLAENTAPQLDWKEPERQVLTDGQRLEEWLKENPNNYTALTERARLLIAEKKWAEAKEPLRKLVTLYPDQSDANSAWTALAMVHRELGELDAEVAALNKLSELSDNAPEAYARLMEIAAERNDWEGVVLNAERFIAVNPLEPKVRRLAAEAHEKRNDAPAAIRELRALIKLDPPDISKAHYRLARLLHKQGDAAARRHVLMALEEAPRLREAHALLLEITGGKPARPTLSPATAPKSEPEKTPRPEKAGR